MVSLRCVRLRGVRLQINIALCSDCQIAIEQSAVIKGFTNTYIVANVSMSSNWPVYLLNTPRQSVGQYFFHKM